MSVTSQDRIQNAYTAGKTAMENYLKSDEFQQPTLPADPECETWAAVTPRVAALYYLTHSIPAFGMCFITTVPFWARFLLTSTGGYFGPYCLARGVLFLTKDTPYPKEIAGHLMALKERVSIAVDRCLCRKPKED